MEIGESIDVRVVNVEAVVTDRSGQHIKGLKPTDFRLLVDGKEVLVDYFTEIRRGAAVEANGDVPASPVSGTVGRNLLIFVDQSYTIQTQLALVLRRLEEDLDRLAPDRPGGGRPGGASQYPDRLDLRRGSPARGSPPAPAGAHGRGAFPRRPRIAGERPHPPQYGGDRQRLG